MNLSPTLLRKPLCLLRTPALLLGALLLWPALGHAQIVGVTEADDRFGSAAAVGDFDGDSRDDLAVGVPGEDIGTVQDAGAVNVLYGTLDGLNFDDNQVWSQNTTGIDGVPEAFDLFGAAVAVGDFDGDGRDDLAVGSPFEDVGAAGNAGAVNVIYGSAGGLTAAGNQVWTQNELTYTNAEADDHFGASLTTGDYNGDGYDDLVVGSPDEDLNTVNAAGVVHVLYGSASGLTAAGNEAWYRSLAGHGDPVTFDSFGHALASGDFDGNGRDDFAVGAIGFDVGGAANAGGVIAFYGLPGGITPGLILWSQDTPDVVGVSEAGDQFGFSLTAGDFDGDGESDLAIGVPHEDVGTTSNAGAVNVLYGTPFGLDMDRNQLFDQSSPGIGSLTEANDRFGWSLATGRFGFDSDEDLAIGLYGESIGSIADAGAVIVIAGSGTGLDPTKLTTIWRQGRQGALDRAETGDHFGAALAAGNFDADGDDLAIGVPGEDVNGNADAGAVNVLSLAFTFTPADEEGQFWYQGLNVDVAVTPLDPPSPVVVARGDRIRFRITLTRLPGSPAGLDFWADAVFPNDNENGPYLGPGTVQVPANSTGSATFRQRVGGNTPLGTYLYVVKVGVYPNEVLASAVFTIQVTASEGAGDPLAARAVGDGALDWLATDDSGRPFSDGNPVAWVIDGGPEAALEAPTAAVTLGGLPSAPTLHAAYPNPFQGQATLGFSLPDPAPVRLAVYDALGREVAVLVDGAVEAGAHATAFDASALPSGAYLVRLTTGGVVQTQRLTLVR